MTPLQKQINEFIRHLSAVRRVSPHTTQGYRRDCAMLTARYSRAADITAGELRRLIAACAKQGLHSSSIARALAAWRAFFDYLDDNRGRADNPARAVQAPKKPSRLPRALTPDETARLLVFPAGDDFLNLRDGAMFELLYSSAMRVGELTALDAIHLDLKNGTAEVLHGKGGGGRTVPVGKTAIDSLKKYLPRRAVLLADLVQPALFINRQKNRLGVRTIQQRLTRLAARNHLPGKISPHVLRHSCASHFLQSSGDLRATQELLGHKDITATQIYTRLDFQHLAKTYDAAHPRARR